MAKASENVIPAMAYLMGIIKSEIKSENLGARVGRSNVTCLLLAVFLSFGIHFSSTRVSLVTHKPPFKSATTATTTIDTL